MLGGEASLRLRLRGIRDSIRWLVLSKPGHGVSVAEEGNPCLAKFVRYCFMVAASCAASTGLPGGPDL
jgi:hypothetical protein